MIYKIYIIDSDNGIALLETGFREFTDKKFSEDVVSGFFQEINTIIDVIQEAMNKGQKSDDITRVLESEKSTLIIYYHPSSRLLFCSISDADDDTDKLTAVMYKIANRFWKKHKSDIKIFRTTTEKSTFQTIITDIENLTHEGKIAETYPKLLVVENVLEKIHSMGMITEFEFDVALSCTGSNSPLSISRKFGKTRMQINEILNKLKQLDIIRI